jgi:hypothetical protein
MRRKLKLYFYFLLVFIATSAGAQTSGFDPFHPDLPRMIVSWEDGCKPYWGSDSYGVEITSETDTSICNSYVTANAVGWSLDDMTCFSGSLAPQIKSGLRAECKDRLSAAIKEFKNRQDLNDCSYIAAELVSIDVSAGLSALSFSQYKQQAADCFGNDYGGPGNSYRFNQNQIGMRDNLLDFIGLDENVPCNMSCGTTGTAHCTKDVRTIRFTIIPKEEGCIIHDGSADNKECRDCYEDRHLVSGAKRNPDRDGIHNSSPPTGGYIRSQGCIPQSGTQKIAQIGGNAMSTNPGDIAININSIISNPVTGVIDLFLPPCVTDPLPPPALYSQFEGYDLDKSDSDKKNTNNPSMADPNTGINSKQQVYAYDVVDSEYNKAYTSVATSASYKGNCGRGKFFYDTIDAKDSNLSPNTSTQFKAIRSESNDIWQSRTGCYNPEERFVLEQIGQVKRPQDENSTTKKITSPIKFHDPFRPVGNPVKDPGFIGAGFSALNADYRNKVIKNIKAGIDITDDARRPWDSPDLEIEMTSGTNPTPTGRYKDGSDIVIDGSSSATVTYLVPNDRVLMRHPMCIRRNQTGISSTDVNEILKALPNKLDSINNMILSDDPQKVKVAGSLPVCLIDDRLDDIDDFCSHYLERTNETIAIGNVNLPISTKTNYNNPRYVFDAKDFCWKKTTDAIFENFDPNESWLPPAFKATQSSAIVVRKDIFGKDHNYETTDFIRPNLTHYASRVVKDVGIAGAAIPAYNHKLVSLEEYGYRDVPVARTDYQINPFNIYAPNTTQTFTREKLQVKANMGRKAKLQQCLRLYLEQWAFEGDKGAIVVDSSFKSKRIARNETIQTAPDSSMCQWVAYYNTTDNQGKEDIFGERAQFKAIMMFYFSKLQDLNKEYASNNDLDEDDAMLGFTAVAGKPVFLTSTSFNNIVPMGINFSPSNPIGSVMTTVLGTGSASAPGTDPERLQGISGNNPVLKINYGTGNLEMDLSGAGTPGWGVQKIEIPLPSNLTGTQVSIGAPLDNMKTNEVEGEFDDKAFRRARGMRPEIFDYYNFLSFSSLSVMYEGLDITNKTTIGDGNPLSGTLEDVKNLTGSIGIDIPVLDNNLYTPSVKIEMSSPPSLASLNAEEIFNSIGWQANLERRNCNSVVPPHFWKDVVKPFAYGCNFGQGSKMINNLAHSMKVLNGNVSGNWTIGSVFGTIWQEIDLMGKLTGGGNGPYRHWLTTDIEKPYISTITPIVSLPVYAVGFNIEKPIYFKSKWEKYQSPLSDEGIVMLEDNWLGRVGGMGNVSKNLIQKEWDGEAWIENTPLDAGNLAEQDDIDKQAEYEKFYFNNLGAPSLGAGPASYAKNRSGYKEAKKQLGRGFLGVPILDESDLTDFKSREWVEHTWNANTCMHMRDTFDKPYNISKIILSDPIKKIDSTIKSLYLGELASNHPGKLDSQDAWKVNDDIDHTKAPPLLDLNPPSTTNPEDYYSKKFGGFKVLQNADPFFQWFPNSWSIAVGLNKAFWCEFELPYNPYFTGDADFAFNKTRFKSHFPINNQKNLMFATNIPADAKPKLQLYRVERIRDACGPYGVRSTWVDDISPSQNIAKWLLNDYTDSDDDIDDDDALLNPKIQNRCGAWLDIYRKYHHDPKIISWRLPRFDYEFMKAFFDCTGPRRTVGPSPCKWNEAAHKENISNAIGEAMKGVMNVLLVVVQELLKGLGIDVDIPPTECIIATGQSICAEIPYDTSDGCNGVSVIDIVFAQASLVLGPLSQQMGVPVPGLDSPALKNGCYQNDNGEKFKLGKKIADNFLRAADYATRGDLYYGREEGNGNDPTDPETNMGSKNGTDPKFGLEGFRDHKYHSTQVQNYWLYKDNETNKSAFSEKINSDEPYGFWCSCPEDDLRTTRCREDFCTVDQHVLLVGRNLEFINKIQDLLTNAEGDQEVTVLGSSGENSASGTVIGCEDDTNGDGVVNGNDTQPTDPANCTNKVFADEEANKGIGKIAEIGTPVAIAKSYGPFRRWLQCYYQARAKACPVLTRDVSDTPAYSTLVDPFPADRVFQPELAEKTGKGQNFNVCDNANPAGVGNDKLDQFLRWSKEEPNHLARLPVAFESAGGGYKNQDFVFYTQVRDYEAPFMELAVPFPIDLITRYEVKEGSTGGVPDSSSNSINAHLPYCDSENIIPNDILPNLLNGNVNPASAKYKCDKEKMNALGEINQREGTYEIDYNNPRTTTISTGTAPNIVVKQKYDDFNIPAGATPNSTAGNAANEYDLQRIYDKAFRSSLIKKSNTGKIEPSSDADWDNEAYSSLYMKYIKGLYAAKKSYDHNARAGAPKTPGGSYSSDDNRTNPRAEDTIVGPRGCDIGGWYEMMLYQARCIRWFGLNCICDYDKTFARGNAVNYSLRKGGMKFNVAYPALNQNTQFEVEAAVDRYGRPVKETAEDVAIDITGLQNPEIKVSDENKPVSSGELQYKLKQDARGNYIPKTVGLGSFEIKYGNRLYPLSDRGNVGPEFAHNWKKSKNTTTLPTPQTTDYRFKGLSDVRVGDFIYWDESISTKVNGLDFDIGYPRHMAYVEKVNRLKGDDGKMHVVSITVSEMNWGKNLDSCGNTDMWGKTSYRVIKNPGLDPGNNTEVVPIAKVLVPLPGVKIKKPTEKYASCNNADWAVCVEKYWDQVNVYRPYKLQVVGCYDNGILKGRSNYKLHNLTGNPDPSYPAISTQAVTSGSCFKQNASYLNLPTPITNERILALATSKNITNIPDTRTTDNSDVINIQTDMQTAISEYNTAYANSININLSASDIADAKVATSVASSKIQKLRNMLSEYVKNNYTAQQLIADDTLWKLTITKSDIYALDEVENYLNNPLFGTLNRCDPPVTLRDNFNEVYQDTIDALTKKQSNGDWKLDDSCQLF